MADPNQSSTSSDHANVLTIACPCGMKLTVKAEDAGNEVRCPRCQAVHVIPAAAPASQDHTHATLTSTDSLSENDATSPPSAWIFLAPPQAKDEIGRLGPYRVLQVLGSGGMGVVFKAEDPALKRVVALKAMLPSATQSPGAKQRFLREARTAAALKHDHIVCIHQVGEDRDVPFLAMEFLKGESLDDRLKRDERLSIGEALRIGCEVADGLAAAHEEGLIHRDIKPANIWMEARTVRRKDGASTGEPAPARAKILDFGLARGAGDAHLTQTGVIIGTPAYMPPEQARGENVDARCDLYSLGVLLYKMVTGELPFKGGNTLAILSALAMQTPREPMLINPAIPAPLNDLIMRLLAKEAADRPGSAHEVYTALKEIEVESTPTLGKARANEPLPKAGQPVVTANADATLPIDCESPRRRRRVPLIAVGALGVLGALVLGVILLWPTPHGTVRIESDDPNVEVVFDKNGPTIKGASKEPITLKAGPHGLIVKRGDFEMVTDGFAIRNGEVVTLKVELLKDKIQVTRDGKVIASKETPGAVAKVDPPAQKNPDSVEPSGPYVSKTTGMKFVRIKAGTFMMGSPKGEEERQENETQHEVKLTKDFDLGMYAVTRGQFCKFVEDTGYKESEGWLKLGFTQTDDHPVVNVNWDDAVKYAKWLSEKDGQEYRLPTEAEWEYACRGGTGSRYHFGNDEKDLPQYGKFGNASGGTTPVGRYKPNPFGLYDVHGNVWHWCSDWYGEYPTGRVTDPAGAPPGSDRVQRGGSWLSPSGSCRSAYRRKFSPSFRDQDGGFRLARSFPPVPEPTTSLDPDRKAAEFVLSIGGTVKVNDEDPEIRVAADLPAQAFRLTRVDLRDNKQVSDAGLAHFKDCKSLTALDLRETQVTAAGLAYFKDCKDLMELMLWACSNLNDEGLASFKDCKKLTYLNLGYTQVSDKGLANFKDLKNLKKLNLTETLVSADGLGRLAQIIDSKVIEDLHLGGPNLSAEGLAHFNECKNLRHLELSGQKVNDAGLANFKDCKNLRFLTLHATQVSDAGLTPFMDCKDLTYIHLWLAPVSDAGLAQFKEIQNLNGLNLAGTKVSDAGLVHLKECKNLKDLHLKGTKVTATGVADLKKALPDCKIDWDEK